MKTYIERAQNSNKYKDDDTLVRNEDSPFSWKKVLKEAEDSFIINEDENEDAGITPHVRKERHANVDNLFKICPKATEKIVSDNDH